MRERLAHETWSFGRTPEMLPEVLRLRGGAGGDKEKWLCETCGKILVSKRDLDLHMGSVRVSHEDFDCVMSDGVLKWRCSLCCNLLSFKQRIISHLITTHGKEDLVHGKKQNLQSQTTLWRRKRSADGSFIHEQCSSFQDEVSPPNLESYSAISDQWVPHAEGLSSSLPMLITQKNIGGTLDRQKQLNYVTEPPEMSWQDILFNSNYNNNLF